MNILLTTNYGEKLLYKSTFSTYDSLGICHNCVNCESCKMLTQQNDLTSICMTDVKSSDFPIAKPFTTKLQQHHLSFKLDGPC